MPTPRSGTGSNYEWLPLDNAAKIYPAVRSQEHTTVFRISVILYEPVNYNRLLHAVRTVELRFPYFKVSLRKGFFWYYLEHIDSHLSPVPDNRGFCRNFESSAGKDALLFRIAVIRNRISVEFSHILTDGAGAATLLTALLHAYLSERGTVVSDHPSLTPGEMSDQEFEDAYNRYFQSGIPPVIQYSKAFHLPFKLAGKPRFHTLVAILSVNDVKSKAKEKGVSITDYLVAVYLYILQELFHELPKYSGYRKRKILRIQVPVNLRKIYPARTLRNFSLFVLPELDLRLGRYTFEEIIKIVYHRMQLETDAKIINKIISRNVGSERNIMVRSIPLLLKNLILRYKFYTQGANQYSGVVTNLGNVELPEEMMQKIRHFVFIPPPPNRKLKVNCGVIGFRDELVISFGNITISRELEKKYFRFLTSEGIHVKLTAY